MTEMEYAWTTPDQIKIYGKEWKIKNPKAVIALVHGLGEHCNRYNHVADFFTRNDIAMVAYDRRGHGQSAGKRGHAKNYDLLLDEVDELLRQTRNRYPDTPVILYGHSMGGNMVLKMLISRKLPVRAVIATGAFIEFPEKPPAVLIAIGKLMRKIYPAFSQDNNLKIEGISRDSKVVEAYKNDPLVHSKITSGTAIGMIEVANELATYKGAVAIPTLIMHGTQDMLTGCDGSKKFAQNVTGPVTYKEWEGAYHELHNEPNRQEVFDYTLKWMKEQL